MLLFCDSFDYYKSPQLALRYESTFFPSITATISRNGPQCLIANSTQFVQKNFTAKTTVIVGVAINANSASSENRIILAFMDGSVNQCCLTWSGTHINFNRGLGTQLGFVPQPTFNIWHYMEVQATIGSGTSGSFIVRIDGIEVLNVTGVNTQSSGNTRCTGILIGDTQAFDSGDMFYDDLYICDTLGSTNNTFLGDIKVQAALPTANGTVDNFSEFANSWVASLSLVTGVQIIDSNGNLQRVTTAGTTKSGAHPTWATSTASGSNTTADNNVVWTCIALAPLFDYQYVNEIPEDADSSYVSDSTSGHQERFLTSGFSGATIKAMTVTATVRGDNLGSISTRLVAFSNGTLVDSGTDLTLQQTYGMITGIFETDPSTLAPWTITGASAAEYGLKIV